MFKKLKKVCIEILIVLLVLIAGFVVYHHVKNNMEKNKYSELFGENLKIVNVNNKKMSCYEKGTGDKTIVLLSGFGTPSPIANFMPLSDELSKKL